MTTKCPRCQAENPETQRFCGDCGTRLTPAQEAGFSRTETLRTPPEEPMRGTSFAGRYLVIEELGSGGMGKVFRVEDTKLGQEVALKLIKPEIAADRKTIERFRNELKTARMISHRNICRMFDLGEADGAYFITMEYVPGESLKSMLRMSKRLEAGTAVSIARQVCEGLAEAHRLEVVHRDLKPSNIMIDRDGNVRIMDFGIARSLKEKGITGAGMMVGTPEYMSPEQVEGQEADQRSDIYSLGVILYEMLTGRVPFQGDTPFSVALKQRSEAPQDPRELNAQIPDDLGRVVQKCLVKDRRDRYQSAADLKSALEDIEEKLPTAEKAITRGKTGSDRARSRLAKRLWLRGAVFAFLAVLVGGVYFLTTRTQTKPGVAVLPFSFEGGSPDDQAFADGLSSSFSDGLLRLERACGRLWVIPPDNASREGIENPSQANQVLGGDYVITGRMRRNGDIFQLTLSLVDGRTLLQKGTPAVFADPVTNLKTWQEDTVIKAAEMLGLKAGQRVDWIGSAGMTSRPRAYELYLRGTGCLMRSDKEGSIDKALEYLRLAAEQDPQFAQAWIETARAYRSKYSQTADPSLLAQAESSCRRALEINSRLAEAELVLGIIHREAGRYDDSAQDLGRALTLEPKYYRAYIELGYTDEKLERLTEAERSYKKARKLRPRYADVYSNLGYFYYVYGQIAKAERAYLKVTRLTPGSVLAYNNLGGMYATQGRYDLAEAMFKKSMAVRPNGTACSNLGTIYFSQRRYGDSAVMFEEAVKLDEKDPSIWGNLGDAYRSVPESSEKAADAYQRAVRLGEDELAKNPDDSQIMARLARFRVILGDRAKALEEMAHALKISPSDGRVLLKGIQVYELAGQRDAAIQSLREFIGHGGSREEIDSDPDLTGLMKDPRAQSLAKGWKTGK